MAATTTEFNSLLQALRVDFPHVTYSVGDGFYWSPASQTVYFQVNGSDAVTLLHETAHAILGHTSYSKDIDLIHLERDAWNKTVQLGSQYTVSIDISVVEEALDTYRDWLHARSLCPNCKQNGIQTDQTTYSCVLCDQCWLVNDARSCGLRRHKIKPSK